MENLQQTPPTDNVQLRKQTAHTKAEQRRRDSIKNAYSNLCSILPINQSDNKSPSKASILQNGKFELDIQYTILLTLYTNNI